MSAIRLWRRLRQLPLALNESGFTLLEVMIAATIMVMAFSTILMVQSGSITATEKARRTNMFTMLARKVMVEAELETKGKQFGDVQKEKEADFESPFEGFHWKREIREIEFPSFNFSGGGEEEGGAAKNASSSAPTPVGAPSQDQVGQAISKYLSKSLREIVVTITKNEGKLSTSVEVSTYWVNLSEEFSLGF